MSTYYTKYKATVGNGYLIPSFSASISDCYDLLYAAAQTGDEKAQEILHRLPVAENEKRAFDKVFALNICFAQHSISLWNNEDKEKPLDKLQRLAEEGNFLAQRFLGHIVRRRLTNPEFVIWQQ